MLALVIQSEVYENDFLDRAVLGKFLEQNECILIIDEDSKTDKQIYKEFKQVFELSFKSSRKTSQVQLFQNVLMYKNREKSKSFRYKFERNFPSLKEIYNRQKLNKKHLNILAVNKSKLNPASSLRTHTNVIRKILNILRKVLQRNVVKVLSSNLVFRIYSKFHVVNKLTNKELEDVLLENKIDTVIFPTGSMLDIDVFLINICRSNNIKTLFIINNWDNLSSKTIFWKKPDFLGVWGPQSVVYARAIHRFEPAQIFNLGSARYSYFERNKISKAPQASSRNILFVGTQHQYDEFGVLLDLDKILDLHKGQHINLIYKPYPGSFRILEFYKLNLKHVQIDDGTKALYDSIIANGGAGKVQTLRSDISYNSKLLQSVDFCVGGLSSMLIEASLLGKYYIGFAFSEKYNLTSPRSIHMFSTHLEDIDMLPNLFLCYTRDEVKEKFEVLINSRICPPLFNLESNLSYFVNTDCVKFGERLNEVVRWIS